MLSVLSSAFGSTFSANTQSKIGIAVARTVLDSAEAEGEAAIRMIEDAAAVGKQALRSGSRANRGQISPQAGARETGQRLDVSA